MFDSWESIVTLVVALLIAYAVILWLGLIVWTVRDVRERTRDNWTQTVSIGLVGLFYLPGLVLYLILRPHETLTEAYERRLEAEALKRDSDQGLPCPGCSRPMEADFLLCPYCRTKLREPCGSCGRSLERSWTACPQCGADGPQAIAASSGPFASERQAAAPARATAPPPPAETPQARSST